MARIYGYASPEEMIAVIGSIDREVYVIPEKRLELKRLLALNGEVKDFEVQQRRKDGSTFWVSLTVHAVYAEDGSILFWEGRSIDITERKQAEEALRQSEERLSLSLEATEDGVWDWNIPTGYAIFSPRWYTMLGFEPYEFPQTYDSWRTLVHPDDVAWVEREIREYLASGEGYAIEIRMRTKSGGWRWILTRGKVVERDPDGRPVRMVGTHSDVTERRRAQEEREKLEAQLLQAQKMESVGRLAGGVAHDFNNMLGVIIGHCELAMDHIDLDGPLSQSLHEIRKAAERSAALTRQLLAFARKQTISPKVLDLNDTVSGMLKMLRRLIGEDLELSWVPGRNLWKVRMDPSQIDQILANMAVNAHDAILGVGSITLKTENVVITDPDQTGNPELAAGDYVLLTVSDTGAGMSREVLEHIFEPFFTTKDMGKGTGLGLATVYGIVKQNNGFIDVESQLGRGTTFRIYLPRFESEVPQSFTDEAEDRPQGGAETILVVEDDAGILQLVKTMLTGLGYRVIAVRTPTEALRSLDEHAGEIHLLITDVVMPQMNGRELAVRLCALRPDLKVLYMSGYTDNVIAHRGALDERLNFIPKPFCRRELARLVRALLGQAYDTPSGS